MGYWPLTLVKRLTKGHPLTPPEMDGNIGDIQGALNSQDAKLGVVLNPNGTLRSGAVNNNNDFAGRIVDQNALSFQRFFYFVDAGSQNAIAITTTTNGGAALSAYAAGIGFRVKALYSNSAETTIRVDTLDPRSLKKVTSTGVHELVAGDIISGGVYNIVDDGTQFVVLNPTPQTSFIDHHVVTDNLTVFNRLGTAFATPHTAGAARPLYVQWSTVCISDDNGYLSAHADEVSLVNWALTIQPGSLVEPAFTVSMNDVFLQVAVPTADQSARYLWFLEKNGGDPNPLNPVNLTRWKFRVRWGTLT